MSARMPTLKRLSFSELHARCADGLNLRLGPFVMRLVGRDRRLAQCLYDYYPDYPLAPDDSFADGEIRLLGQSLVARALRRPLCLGLEDGVPFTECAPGALLAHLEWAINWCVASRAHHYLMLHAAVIERNGHALLLPGQPGAGKSTLCAWLIHRGWRLLSDEFTLIRDRELTIDPLPRLIPLKNESIALIREHVPAATFGPCIPGTRKGTVSHLSPPLDHLRRMAQTARPRWVVFPQYDADASPEFSALHPAECFSQLTQNAFNYTVLGREAFERAGALTDAVDAWRLRYRNLQQAEALLNALTGGSPTC